MTPEQRIAILEVQLQLAQSEATELRKRLAESTRHARRVTLAHQHAILLTTWHYSGVYPSRAYASTHGISQRAWQNAIGLLRMARVVAGRRRWVVSDLPLIIQKLDREKEAAIQLPEAFTARLNRHARNERHEKA